ncbi:MAG: hypothetical protein J6M44_09485 [Butyrivibrio sp.]|nr:hypothetical protein [Butyrivibrio sp.]
MGKNTNIYRIYELFETLSIEDKEMVVRDLTAEMKNTGTKRVKKVNTAQSAKSQLEKAWERISNEISELEDAPYIDDNIEITYVWNICDELIESGNLGKESWELRKKIIKDIIKNHYYDEYSVDDPLEQLMHAMCTNKKEKLECAEMLLNSGYSYLVFDGAKIYKELGQPGKYYKMMEKYLSSNPREYLELIEYYKDTDLDKACEIAERGLKKCYQNRTEFLICLIQRAKDKGDEEQYYKLLRGARLRSYVDVGEIYEKFGVDKNALRVAKAKKK